MFSPERRMSRSDDNMKEKKTRVDLKAQSRLSPTAVSLQQTLLIYNKVNKLNL